MRADSALSRLKDGELCIVTTKDGEHEVRWSTTAWCFLYLDRGTPVVCHADEIDEWRSAFAHQVIGIADGDTLTLLLD